MKRTASKKTILYINIHVHVLVDGMLLVGIWHNHTVVLSTLQTRERQGKTSTIVKFSCVAGDHAMPQQVAMGNARLTMLDCTLLPLPEPRS